MDVGEYGTLEVVTKRRDGLLLDWGKPQPLFMPDEEVRGGFEVGDWLVVFVTLDKWGSPQATMRLRDYLNHDASLLKRNQKVELIVFGESDLGFDCIVEQEHRGILYHNEVFQDLSYGSIITGYVKKIRDDGKVDLMTQLRGTKGSSELGERILEEMRENDGFLPLNDKSSPTVIYDLFGVSKKKFKMAIGGLFKKRKISIDPDGIRIVTKD